MKLEEVNQMIGQEFWYYESTAKFFIPIVLVRVEFNNCSVKGIVRPLYGKGEFGCCLSDLTDEDTATRRATRQEAVSESRQQMRKLLNSGFLKQRRKAFVEFLETAPAQFAEEAKETGIPLNKMSDRAMCDMAQQIYLVQILGEEALEEDLDEDDDDCCC